MCPGCLTTAAALAVAGATVAGKLTAFTVKLLHKTGQERPDPAKEPYDGGSIDTGNDLKGAPST
jgi:hypothetical protein